MHGASLNPFQRRRRPWRDVHSASRSARTSGVAPERGTGGWHPPDVTLTQERRAQTPRAAASSTSEAPARPADAGSGFRSDVQALRALAVALVLTYHLWPGAVPGGYVGVDVFSVISGFLITQQLLGDAAAHSRVRPSGARAPACVQSADVQRDPGPRDRGQPADQHGGVGVQPGFRSPGLRPRADEALSANDFVAAAARSTPGVTFVPTRRFFCRAGWCPSIEGGVRVYWKPAAHQRHVQSNPRAPDRHGDPEGPGCALGLPPPCRHRRKAAPETDRYSAASASAKRADP